MTLEEKLLYRPKQYFRSSLDWLQEAIESTLSLAGEDVPLAIQEQFARNLRALCDAQSTPILTNVSSRIAEFPQQWDSLPFQVIAYALWRAGTEEHLIAVAVPKLEVYVKQRCTWYIES